MKKLKQLAKISLLALAISLGSCSSDDGGSSTGGNTAEGTISAKVDGKSITTMNAATIAVMSGDFLNVSGTTMSGENISIVIYNYEGNGTYNVITGNDLGAIFTYTKVDFNNPTATNSTWYAPLEDNAGTSGTVTVTESSTERVKGTFSFKGVNESGTFKDVKNGSFNVLLNQQGQ